jgi:hypothetical protein
MPPTTAKTILVYSHVVSLNVRAKRPHPAVIDALWAVLEADCPLAALRNQPMYRTFFYFFICRILQIKCLRDLKTMAHLPHGHNAGFENVVVGIHLQLTGRLQKVPVTPKCLNLQIMMTISARKSSQSNHRVKGANQVEIVLKVAALIPGDEAASIIPKVPAPSAPPKSMHDKYHLYWSGCWPVRPDLLRAAMTVVGDCGCGKKRPDSPDVVGLAGGVSRFSMTASS